MINPLIIKDKVCSSDAKGLLGSTGWLFAWLGDATDCRCCLGMRIALGLIVGGIVGYLIGVYPVIGLTAMCAILMTMAVMFSIWMMVQEQNKRDEQDDDEWLKLALNNGYDNYNDELNQLYGELDERGINLSEDDIAWVADKHLTLRTQYGNNIPFSVIVDNIAGSLIGAVNMLKSAKEIDADDLPTHELSGKAKRKESIMSRIIACIEDKTDDKHGLPISLNKGIERDYDNEGINDAGIEDTNRFIDKQVEMALNYIQYQNSKRSIKNELINRGLILDDEDMDWFERRYEAIDDEYNGNILDGDIADILYEEYKRLNNPPAPLRASDSQNSG